MNLPLVARLVVEAVEDGVRALERARRPVFVAGRGARTPAARDALIALAERHGALLATSAVARGLFRASPWSLDVSGGFASPLATELIRGADDQPPLIERDGLGGLQPRPDRMIRKLTVGLIENALPCVFGGQLHRTSKTVGD